MTMRPSDTILGPPRGFHFDVMQFARQVGSARLDELDLYVAAVYRDAISVGIDPAIAVAQSALETDNWRDKWWRDRLNPAGIGITGDPAQNEASKTWDTGTDSACAQLVHLWLYARGRPLSEYLLPYLSLDPRADAIPAANLGSVRTLADLGGRWATVADYGDRIARRARDIFPDLPNQEKPSMAVRFEKRIATIRLAEFGTLRDRYAWFTIHENGNPGSSPFDEARFVAGGGGAARVMYHFSVGVEDGQPTIVQIFPANKRGKHAGNSEGNAVSLAVETCQAPPGAISTQTQAALEELLYMIYTHDPRIDWGSGDHVFHPDRTRGHFQWPGANPGCPATMLRLWGGISRPVNNVRRRLAEESPVYAKPEPIPELADVIDNPGIAPAVVALSDGTAAYFINDRVEAVRQTKRLQKANATADRIGPDLKAGEQFGVAFVFRSDDGEDYYYTPFGTRIRVADTKRVRDLPTEEEEAA